MPANAHTALDPPDGGAGAEWHQAYGRRAREHWTPERVQSLLAGKDLALRPDRAPHLLRAIGVLDAHARLVPRRERKLRQVSHLLGFLRPALEEWVGERDSVALIDAGCGRSALGFVVAWWLRERGVAARVLGIDRNPEVVAGCAERAAVAGLDTVRFAVADLEDGEAAWREIWGETLDLDGLFALHACDTATDHALALAASSGARFFAVAPCCQAELAAQWASRPSLGVLHSNPHLRRELAATVTDAMRVELMRAAGFDVRACEFVEAHHTPKNTLIYGHRSEPGPGDAYRALRDRTGGCDITLARRLGLV